jgi:hypothetical protein
LPTTFLLWSGLLSDGSEKSLATGEDKLGNLYRPFPAADGSTGGGAQLLPGGAGLALDDGLAAMAGDGAGELVIKAIIFNRRAVTHHALLF